MSQHKIFLAHANLFLSPKYPLFEIFKPPLTKPLDWLHLLDLILIFFSQFQRIRLFLFQTLKSGTTAVISLIRGNMLYVGWLGDSQSVLVRSGKPVKVVEPHKPDRPVSSENNG